MLSVLSCLQGQHDLRLVLIAAVICIASVLTAFSVYDRALRAAGPFRAGWVAVTGLIAGCGAWATHFMGMLAYQPQLLIGYDPVGTVLSLFAALASLTLAFSLPVAFSGRGAVLAGGVVAGLGVGVMHFLGMSAAIMPMQILWTPGYVIASVIGGALLTSAALLVFAHRNDGAGRTAGGLLFAGAILFLHFTAMTGVTLVPDSTIPLEVARFDRTELAIMTGAFAAGLLLTCLGLLWVESQSHRGALTTLRSSLDALPAGMAFMDPADRLVVWNLAFAAFAAHWGLAPAVGMKGATLRAVCLGDAGPKDNEHRRSDGRWIRAINNATPDGGSALILVDITADREQAEAMAAARDAAEAANRAKSEFLANMSHEIRTPLNGVMGAAELLAREPLIGHQAELVQMIHASGDTLNRLLSDILDLARVETGKLDIVQEPFDLAEAVRTAAALFRLKAEEKGLTFTLRIAPEAEGRVIGDPIRLRQILGNLLSNAVKFTPQGEVVLSVDRADGLGGPFRFQVTDTGPGFDAVTRARLFNRFEQADSSIARRYGGSGLGLAISREMTLALGGKLACRSAPGQGATFTLTLPLTTAADQAASSRDLSTAAAAGATDAGQPMRVLIVDDHPNNRRFLEILLEHAGVETVSADDGQAGVDAWRTGGFDAVLMDMQMPVMDGLAATRAIRALELAEGRLRTPVFVISANALAEHQTASHAAGADLHLAKPVVAAELFSALSALPSSEMQAVA
ncbi:MAG: ATP-binding protein [Caulobacter sp.]